MWLMLPRSACARCLVSEIHTFATILQGRVVQDLDQPRPMGIDSDHPHVSCDGWVSYPVCLLSPHACVPAWPLKYMLQHCDKQGAHCVHYSLIFIVYTILFTICTLLKLYTIGYIAGSGGKNKGYRFKMSQLSSTFA